MSSGRNSGRLAGLRWAACFVLVLVAHATAAAALLTRWQPVDEAVAGGPVILIDLAPVAAMPPAAPSEAAPGPQRTQAAQPPAADPANKPAPEKATAALTPPVETPPPPETPAVAEVVLPPPRPPHKVAEQHEQKQRHRLADLNSVPPKAERTAPHAVAPAPGAASHKPDAVPNWKSELVARLERYKRYPSEAEARGEQGVAQLAFSVDRNGGVHNARIVRSSGSGLLDRATLDLIARAQPLPPPPPEMRGAQIAITVPINYNLRAAR
ncbi:MAG TPA: energy transducer TonB [Pseudolabrys sp.]|nr:energy transducer TonB [Pseudolabrys sp.]